MMEIPGITRREFIQSSALATASVALAQALKTPHALAAQEAAASKHAPEPVFPYGAVYFRKTNPPEQDWARDHQTAAHLGMNIFRHWFIWSAIEAAPGQFEWSDYDRMMDLAAENGMKVVIAEIDNAAPEWAFRKYAHTRLVASDGTVAESVVWESSETGGLPGLCLDNPDAQKLAENFLVHLIERYRRHPALFGYDLWNENTSIGGTPNHMYCYCEGTKQRMRAWLRKRYGSLETVAKTWHRYSYETWEDVEPPVSFSGYSDSLDWLQFRVDNAFDLFDWRIKLFRTLDPNHRIIAHGVAGTLDDLPSSSHNEWRSAERVDIYGLTWIAARKGAEPWKQFHAMDLVRCGSRGKPFWHAEAEGGPLWMQPQVIGRPREDGRIPEPEDVRIWNLITCASGGKGLLYCRWRPLLDGPLFGAFGPFGMDGSVEPQAEMAGKVARWTNEHGEVWKSNPVRGEVGLLFVPESEIFNYVQLKETTFYNQSICGAYQAFFDSNIQADFVAIEDMAEYKLLYLPYPVMLSSATAAKIRSYVEQGGMLICEGLPGYFGDHGHVGTVQPNLGLDEVFGARESYVEFVPDIEDLLKMQVKDARIYGRYFRQEYTLRGGTAVGQYENGRIAAVEHTFGRGRTLLMGSFPGAGYSLHHGTETKELFAGFLEAAGIQQTARISDTEVQARLQIGDGGNYLWVTNPTRSDRGVRIRLAPEYGSFSEGQDIWKNQVVSVSGREVSLGVCARDAAVIRLK
jgi:beta-galactosidase